MKISNILKNKMIALNKSSSTQRNLEFMPNTSAAILMQAPTGGRLLIYLSGLTVITFILWAYFAKIDVTIRGSGKVVPASRVQIVQNLEGGIISEILVSEGQQIKKSQPVIKLDNTRFEACYRENEQEYKNLLVTSARLSAEINEQPFVILDTQEDFDPEIIEREKHLYQSRQNALNNELSIAKEQVRQHQQQLYELNSRHLHLNQSLKLASRELALTRPLSKEGAISEVDLLRLEQRVNELQSDFDAAKLSIPRIESTIQTSQHKVDDVIIQFKHKTISEQKAVQLKLAQLHQTLTAHRDRVNRTLVRSPVSGTVKKIHFSTLGGVVHPGKDLLDIVPDQDQLLVEARIQPKDIAFLRPGLPAVVKLSAYDFATHGSLKGVVEHISADSIQDDSLRDNKSFYIVRIRTEKNHLSTPEKPIIPGMTASIDVITTQRTILASILKPILKAKEQALRER